MGIGDWGLGIGEEKNEPPKRSMDIINKNLNTNGNHSNNTGKIIKAKKMNEFENIKSEKNIGKSLESLYILKDIFSFLSEKLKLKIIIYNKDLQKKLDINIEDYKRIGGIYKEGEKNGKGKEYCISTDIMIFEGEYLKGKRNGKGKEYYSNGKLKFEGEYLDNKRWKGNIYNYNGFNTLYQLNNEKNNIVKEYNCDGKLIFEGEYLNGLRNGKGKEYSSFNGKLIFEGEYLNGERNGKGKEYNDNGK